MVGTLSNLKGCKNDVTDIYFARPNITSVRNGLAYHRAVMVSGDRGCVTIYKDDINRIHCVFDSYMVERSHLVVNLKSEIKEWFNEWVVRL